MRRTQGRSGSRVPALPHPNPDPASVPPYIAVVDSAVPAEHGSVPPGPNPAFTIKARATVRGMVVYDHEDMRAKMVEDVSQWLRDGKVQYLEDRTNGLANAPEAFSQLMQGNNVGKSIVVVSE